MADMQCKLVAPFTTVMVGILDYCVESSNNSIIPMFDSNLSSSSNSSKIQGQLFLPAGILVDVNLRSAPFILTISEPLSETFAEGWNGLPVALKRYIVSFLLVEKQPISHDGPTGFKFWRTLDSSLDHQYYKLLHTTPEIATLSREIFYQENTFSISVQNFRLYVSAVIKINYSHQQIPTFALLPPPALL